MAEEKSAPKKSAGTEEMAALDGAAGDFDEGSAFGDESESSAHTRDKT
jgi:hypothetical protein